jgi:hypothetical protein
MPTWGHVMSLHWVHVTSSTHLARWPSRVRQGSLEGVTMHATIIKLSVELHSQMASMVMVIE